MLTYVTYAVAQCPNKYESAASLAALKESGHHLIMITGDQPLTACHVARELGICCRPNTLILSQPTPTPLSAREGGGRGAGGGGGESVASLCGEGGSSALVWRSADGSVSLAFDPDCDPRSLSRRYDLCFTGVAWQWLTQQQVRPCMHHA